MMKSTSAERFFFMMITMSLTDTTFPIFSLTDMGCAPSPLPAHHTPTRDLVLGSWGETMRDAVRNKERWKRAPYAYPRS